MPTRLAIPLLTLLVALGGCEFRETPTALDGSVHTVLASAPISSTTYFAITPLPGSVVAQDINDLGHVSGVLYDAVTSERGGPFFWTPGDAAVTPLPVEPVPGLYSAVAVSPTGQVAATADDCTFDIFVHCAFVWSQADGRQDLYPLSDHRTSVAWDIDAGLVVGESRTDAGTASATVWTLPAGTIQYVGPPAFERDPDHWSVALAVSSTGEVVGDWHTLSDGRVWPFRWTEAGGFEVLTGLVDAITALAAAEGRTVDDIHLSDVNASGQVVGYWERDSPLPPRRPFLWSDASGLVDFEGLYGVGDAAFSPSLNDLGQVLLNTRPDGTGGELVPWVWSAENGLVRLPTPVPDATVAAAINGNSLITGQSGYFGSVIWTPLTDAAEVLDALADVLDGVLTAREVEGGAGLRAKLDQIRAHLRAGRANAARNQLQAFLNQLDAMVADGRLTAEEGDALRTAAEALAVLLP